MKRLDGLQPPILAFLALVFGPHDSCPAGSQDQVRTSAGDFHAVAARFVEIKEKIRAPYGRAMLQKGESPAGKEATQADA